MKAQLNTYDMNRVNLWEYVPLDTPFQLDIENTFICNFRCNYCLHSLDRKTLESRDFHFEPMKWEHFEAILKQMQEFPHNIKKICFTGFGEPTLDERLPDMIRMAMETGKVDKTLVISNGSLLTPELSDRLLASGLSELKISLQGMSAEKYQEVCGALLDFDRYLENLRYFSAHRKQCALRVKIADVSLGPGEERRFYDTFGELCDYIAIEHIYPQFNGVDTNVMPDVETNRFGFRYVQKHVCSTLFFKLNVLQSGKITFGYPDGITYDDFFVDRMTLMEAWNSPERKRLLYDNLTGDRSTRECCKTCRRWSYSVVPRDDIDGHEQEVLSRLDPSEYNIPRENLRKETIICYDGA